MRHVSWLWAVACAAAACGPKHPLQLGPAGDFMVTAASRTEVSRVTIQGRDGRVTVQRATGDSVVLRLALSKPQCGQLESPPTLRSSRQGEQLTVSAEPSTKSLCDEIWVVELPEGVALSGRFDRTDVQVLHTSSDLDLHVGNGTVWLDVSGGALKASVQEGDIIAATKDDAYQSVRLRALVGDVKLVVNGRELQRPHQPGPSDWLSLEGSGGQVISLEAEVGNVELRLGGKR